MASAVLAFGNILVCKPGHSWSDGHIAESCDRQRSAGRALFPLPTCLWWAIAGIISVTTDLNHLHSRQVFVPFGIEHGGWHRSSGTEETVLLHLRHQSIFTKTLQEKTRLILLLRLLIPAFDFRYLLLTSLREVIAIGVAERPPMLWSCLRQA